MIVKLMKPGRSQKLYWATLSFPSLGNGNNTALGSVTQTEKIRGMGFGDVFKDGSVKLRTRISSERKEKKTEKPLIIQ